MRAFRPSAYGENDGSEVRHLQPPLRSNIAARQRAVYSRVAKAAAADRAAEERRPKGRPYGGLPPGTGVFCTLRDDTLIGGRIAPRDDERTRDQLGNYWVVDLMSHERVLVHESCIQVEEEWNGAV